MVKAIDLGLAHARLIESAARRQARKDSGLDRVVGSDRFDGFTGPGGDLGPTEASQSVFERQREKLARLRKTRSKSELEKAFKALKEAAKREDRNLLEATINAAQKGATLGEISAALEKVYGRYKATVRPVLGVESAEVGSDEGLHEVRALTRRFLEMNGRRPRIFLAKLGSKGFDRLMQGIAMTYANFGFDVDMGPHFTDPCRLVKEAIESDVHVIGVSFLTTEDQALVIAVLEELKRVGCEDIVVVAGGVVASEECQKLLDSGVVAVFGPGTVMSECAREVLGRMVDVG